MLDIGLAKLGVVAVVALIVIGPKRLPQVAKQLAICLTYLHKTWLSIKQDVMDHFESQKIDEEQSKDDEK